MDAVIKEAAMRYAAAQEEGQRFIRQRWAALLNCTKAALVGSGFYSRQGERLELEYVAGDVPQDACERLEYALGVFKQCVSSKLPMRSQKVVAIPREAADSEVLSSCEELLFVRAWHDPEFLRLGLGALCMHQTANALSMVGPSTTVSAPWGCVGAVLKAGLVLLMPIALAAGIAAAGKQEVGASTLAFYVLGAGVLAAMSATGVGVKQPTGFELAYNAWSRFQLEGGVGVAGSGALEHLRRMAADGVKVPSVAFDLAEMLRYRMSTRELSEPLKATSDA